jgi:TusA-related sulfurtransferase
MSESVIDARGQVCPMPVMLVQKALKDPQVSDPFVVLLNSDSTRENLERFLQGQKRAYVISRDGDEIKMKVSRTGPLVMQPNSDACCCSDDPACGA